MTPTRPGDAPEGAPGMQAITLTQPWATLVAIGAKTIESRSWATRYRGPLAIHAGKGFPKWARELACTDPFIGHLRQNQAGQFYVNDVLDSLPLGAIVATCHLVDCWRTTDVRLHDILTDQEGMFGDYRDDRWAWILGDIVALPEPVPAKGALGLWEWRQL